MTNQEWEKARDEAAEIAFERGRENSFIGGANWEHARSQKEIERLKHAINYTLEHTDDICWCSYYEDYDYESTCHVCLMKELINNAERSKND